MYLVVGLGQYNQPDSILAYGGDEHKIADCIEDWVKNGGKIDLYENVSATALIARVRAKKCRICGEISTNNAGGVNLCSSASCNKKFIKNIDKYLKEVENDATH